MLQTFILLGVLAVAIGIGIWMAGFGHRMYRIFAILFGLGLGAYGVLFVAGQLGFSVSVPLYVIAAVVGIALAVLAFLFQPVGMGVGGLLLGIFYGVGIVFTADTLTGGAIPAVAYTGISVLLMGLCVAYCIARPENGGMLSTALVGSYAISLSIALIVLWFVSGGLNPANLITQQGNFFQQGVALYQMITAESRMFLLGFSAALGILFFLLQRAIYNRHEEAGSYFDDLDEEFPLPASEEQTVDLDDDDAYFADSKKKKRRRHKQPLDDWDDELDSWNEQAPTTYQDSVDSFDVPVEAAETQNTSTAAITNQASSDPVSSVSTQDTVPVTPAITLTPSQASDATGEPTQVFQRVPFSEPSPSEESASAVEPTDTPTTHAHPTTMERPSFAPRSSRRR